MATVPNRRFFENKCTTCAIEDRVCNHEPFGRLFTWQKDFLWHFDNHKARLFMLEIHRRGRKSSTVLNLLIRECDRLARTRHVYVGPTFQECRRICWDDPTMLDGALPDKRALDWSKDKQHLTVTFTNGSVLQFLGGDDPDSLRGVDGQTFGFDEWAQQKEECWTEVLQPIFRQDKSRRAIFMYTPKGLNHATLMFDRAACLSEGYALPTNGRAEKCLPDWYAMRLTAEHSGIIPFDELVKAKNETPLPLFNQEYLCARVMDEEFTLITSAMLDNLPRNVAYPIVNKRVIAVDPAMGGDECVAYVMQGPKIIDTKIMRYRDTMKITGELVLLGNKHDLPHYIIDSVGIGQGICDRLTELKLHVNMFSSGRGASEKTRFKNLRAEAWWYVRSQVEQGHVEYPADDELRRQIPFGSRYNVNSAGQIQMIDKQKIKEELGCSPDRAEAWMMGIYGLSDPDLPTTGDPTLVYGGDEREYAGTKDLLSV